MQFHGGSSLYVLLNQSLCSENRDELKPWFSYLILLLTVLYKLSSQSRKVWLGIKNVDFSFKHKTGTKLACWRVSSCTNHIEILESITFYGKIGLRILFFRLNVSMENLFQIILIIKIKKKKSFLYEDHILK